MPPVEQFRAETRIIGAPLHRNEVLEKIMIRRLLAALLVILTLGSFLLVFIPAYLIRPFVAQSSRSLTIAFALRSVSPVATLILALLGGCLVLNLWRDSRSTLRRAALALTVILLLGSALMSRQNHFEWMFQPMKAPEFVEISKAVHVGGSDIVLGVRLPGEVRAYPIRILAYHHLVNDVVAGQPIVVTY